MEIVRANKYRLYPNATQKAMLHEMFGLFRFTFNNTLGKIKNSEFGTYIVKNGKNKGNTVPKIPSQTELIGLSTKLKDQYKFLTRLPNDLIQSSLTNLYSGVKSFYKGSGYPKFKSKKDYNQSFDMKAGSRVRIKDNYIQLNKSNCSAYSKSDYLIKFKKHKTNYDIDKITGFSISKDNLSNYWITITHKIDINIKINPKNEIGIDLGIKDFAICSDGNVIKNHNLTKKYSRKLKLEQRKLSNKNKGSKNKNKQRLKVAKVHRKIKNQRNDFNHKTSRMLIDIYSFIGLESLDIKNMIKNRRLSKAISNVVWSEFIAYLKYKSDENQVQIVQIDKYFPSSKTCSRCGSIKKDLTLQDRTYICPECKFEIDRDLNASINILNESLRISKQARME